MYEIYKFDGRGRVLQVLETMSLAVAKMFALTNTTAKGRIEVLDADTGEVLFIVQGTGANCFPKVTHDVTKTAKVSMTPTL